jgi:hypothetical protein
VWVQNLILLKRRMSMGEKRMNEEGKISKSELDYIINELKQTEKETASTLAVQPARAVHRHQKSQWFKSRILVNVIGAIVILGILFVAGYAYLQKGTLKSSSAVESIQKLSTLATAQAHIKTIVSEKDNKLFGKSIPWDFPGSNRTLFMVVPGEVTAGVDLENLTKKDITLDTDKKAIHITLPHATFVQDPSIDLKKIQPYSSEGILRSSVTNWDDGSKLVDVAKQQIEKEAKQFGLLKIAEDNARLALQDFFKNLNYTVTVTFK